MALVSHCLPNLRIYGPNLGCEYPSLDEESDSRSKLLHLIETFNHKAKRRLDRSGVAVPADFLWGFCFGLLDPISNILVNNLVCCERGHGSAHRKARWDYRQLVRRSLDGQVAFLTRFFPNLAQSQAVRYLLLAEADPMVAARIVASDVGMKRFEFESSGLAVMEILNLSLKCAALAAGHPDPDRLVCAWNKISIHIDKVMCFLDSCNIGMLARLLHISPVCCCESCEDMTWAWHLAACRRLRPVPVPFRHTSLLKRTLEDAIHGFYLLAVALLPVAELRSRFHRSLLKGGHCYGPLDPVSNIIINTIWYDALFPPTVKLELDAVGTRSLHRMENRSLYGLTSFLCTRFHDLDFHQAVHCLLQADANLFDRRCNPEITATSGIEGDMLALHNAHAEDSSNSLEESFLAAATAACHPNPDAQAKFLASFSLGLMDPETLFRLQNHRKLSSADVQGLAMMLSLEPKPCERPLLPLPLTGYPLAELAYAHSRISKKVNAVLNDYEQMPNGDPTFELHMICGVNDQVSGPEYCPGRSSGPPLKFHHSHVNFMATPKSSGAAVHTTPMLFFAEISNDDKGISFCCPVLLPRPCDAQIRCLYCEYMGIRIVHPIQRDFYGRESEFEEVACTKNPCDDNFNPKRRNLYYSNMKIISHRRLMAESVYGRLKEDSFYDDSESNGCGKDMSDSESNGCGKDMSSDISRSKRARILFQIPCSSVL